MTGTGEIVNHFGQKKRPVAKPAFSKRVSVDR